MASKFNSFWVSVLCGPVEYGQLMDSEISWLEPSPKEINTLKDDLLHTESCRGKVYHSPEYFSARLTQSRHL